MKRKRQSSGSSSGDYSSPTKKNKKKSPPKKALSNPFSSLVVDQPSPGFVLHRIESSDDWNSLFQESYFGDVRPAMLQVEVPFLVNSSGLMRKRTFSINHREFPKNDSSKVKMNPFAGFSDFQDVYYSKKAEKFDNESKRKKIALDDISGSQDVFAKDVLRVMKGTAYSKGLDSQSVGDRKRATVAGGLIMTSERMRNPLNPFNAHIELYKVKHRDHVNSSKPSLRKAFSPTSGTFVAARKDGAEKSRGLVDPGMIGQGINHQSMQDIFANYASKKPKHKDKTFEEWRNYKADKITALYPTQKK